MEMINVKFLEENNIDILDTNKDQGISKKKKQAIQKLKESAEKDKIELGENDSTNIIIPNIIQNEEGELLSVDVEITSEENKVRDENILVFDLGGGTFDLTIINIKETKTDLLFNVIGIGGDDRLGGLDFDKAFMGYIIEKEEIDFESVKLDKLKKVGKQKLLDMVIKSKEILSATYSAYIAVPDVIPRVHIDAEYTREDFEKSIKNYLKK